MPEELPESLLRFIDSTVPTLQAAEVLLFLAAHQAVAWKAEDIVHELKPVAITIPAVEEYLSLFKIRGILKEDAGAYRYDPSSSELISDLAALTHSYNERPVTLIRTIYRLADTRIRYFADSFKLRKEWPMNSFKIALYVTAVMTSLACTILLARGYLNRGIKLLLWSSICFAGLTINNLSLFLDLVIFPAKDLRLPRVISALLGMLFLLYGFIWHADEMRK